MMRFLALGDSYTIGEAVLPEERWGHQLCAQMRQNGIEIGDPEIIAQTGWTTDELLIAIQERSPKGPYDWVSLLIGVNNQYRGYSLEVYAAEFKHLLEMAIGFAGGNAQHVLVLSIPDWGVTPFAEGRDRVQISHEIDEFNVVNARLTKAAGAYYVDITPHSRMNGAIEVAGDGLHPSGAMYSYWSALAWETVSRNS